MKLKIITSILILLILGSCASIPKETVILSQTLGKDLAVLHKSHKSVVELYYEKITDDITNFIDDVYAPFVIHYVLKVELENHQKGKPSLYGAIESAGKTGGKSETEEALNVMMEFQEDAKNQIEEKRSELLNPILEQKRGFIAEIDSSYKNVIYANATITGYLESIRKVKEAQQEALSIVGLEGKETSINEALLKVSKLVKTAVKKGKEIDIKSDEAYDKIEEISNQIKQLTTKN